MVDAILKHRIGIIIEQFDQQWRDLFPVPCHTRDLGNGWLPRPQSLQRFGADDQTVDVGLHLRRRRIGLNTCSGDRTQSGHRQNESKPRFVASHQVHPFSIILAFHCSPVVKDSVLTRVTPRSLNARLDRV